MLVRLGPYRSSSNLHNDSFIITYRMRITRKSAVGPHFEEGAFLVHHVIDFSAAGGILGMVCDVTEKAVTSVAWDGIGATIRSVSSLSSQNLEVMRRVTSLLSTSKNMQFCNEQIRTQPLFSPPCASATYGSARMCRRKNTTENARRHGKWNSLPSKHTTSSQRREDVQLGRREDVLFAPTLGWKDVFWRRLEKTSSRRLVDVKAWRRIIVVFWLILCWKDVFATLYVRCL